MHKVFAFTVGMVVLSATTLVPVNAARYTIKDVGTLGGTFTDANAINNLGQVAGRSSLMTDPPLRAYIWDPTTGMMNLGAMPPDYPDSLANDLNDQGEVVGEVMYNGWHAVRWKNGSLTQLLPGRENSIAYGINNSGKIVGIRYGTGSQYKGFVWENGVISNLPTLGGSVDMAYGINESGQLAGWANTKDNKSHAVLWTNGIPKDLGTIGGTTSWAHALNDNGQVVGMSESSSVYFYAFIWQNGNITSLGALPGYLESDAQSINNSGFVVGRVMGGLPTEHAFIWGGGVMTDLNTLIPENSGWELTTAKCINDAGQIVGWGTYNGLSRGFVLTPTVPEPCSFVSLASAIGLFLGCSCRCKKRS